MFFLIDNKQKVIFGWSAKCGCSHVKKLFYYLSKDIDIDIVHSNRQKNNLEKIIDLSEYNIIIFVRNPYERLVSGFLDKYSPNGEYVKTWIKDEPLTFRNFVNEIYNNKFKIINEHHFTNQLSEGWNYRLANHEKLFVLDIKSINYKLLERLYSKRIPDNIMNFRGDHVNNKPKVDLQDKKVYDLLQTEYQDVRPITRNFYNEDIKNQVNEIYKGDFYFFKFYGLSYNIPQ